MSKPKRKPKSPKLEDDEVAITVFKCGEDPLYLCSETEAKKLDPHYDLGCIFYMEKLPCLVIKDKWFSELVSHLTKGCENSVHLN